MQPTAKVARLVVALCLSVLIFNLISPVQHTVNPIGIVAGDDPKGARAAEDIVGSVAEESR